MKICLFHPFNASVIGLIDKNIPLFHSRPHILSLEYLSKSGYKIEVVYLTKKIYPYTYQNQYIKWKFFPVTNLRHKERDIWRKQHSIFCIMHFVFNTPDITIINMSGHGSKLSFQIAKVCVLRHKKYIAMIGGLHISFMKKHIEYYSKASKIIVHTHSQKNELLKNAHFKNLDINVLPLGVDCQKFYPLKRKTSNESGPKLCFIGRITPLKRIELAIRSVSALLIAGFSNPSLTIIGPIADNKYYQDLIEFIEKNHLSEYISFLGSKSHEELIKILQVSDVLLLPSKNESFGMVIIESMACGIPVIAVKGSGGPDELIINNVNGLLTEFDTYTKEVVNLFNDADRLNNFKLNAREAAVKNYSLEKTIKLLHHFVTNDNRYK